jgi:hypothetical protein
MPANLTLPAGQYQIEVKTGNLGASETVVIEDGRSQSLQLRLEEILIVVDEATGWIRQKGEPGEKNWQAAIAYCSKLSLSGFSDWRLPSNQELFSIIRPKGEVFQETHESILSLPARLGNSVEAIPGFQGSRNTTPLGLFQKSAE